MKPLRIFSLLLSLLMLACCVRAQAQTLRVAAAADLQFAMKDLSGQYEKKTGLKVETSQLRVQRQFPGANRKWSAV